MTSPTALQSQWTEGDSSLNFKVSYSESSLSFHGITHSQRYSRPDSATKSDGEKESGTRIMLPPSRTPTVTATSASATTLFLSVSNHISNATSAALYSVSSSKIASNQNTSPWSPTTSLYGSHSRTQADSVLSSLFPNPKFHAPTARPKPDITISIPFRSYTSHARAATTRTTNANNGYVVKDPSESIDGVLRTKSHDFRLVTDSTKLPQRLSLFTGRETPKSSDGMESNGPTHWILPTTRIHSKPATMPQVSSKEIETSSLPVSVSRNSRLTGSMQTQVTSACCTGLPNYVLESHHYGEHHPTQNLDRPVNDLQEPGDTIGPTTHCNRQSRTDPPKTASQNLHTANVYSKSCTGTSISSTERHSSTSDVSMIKQASSSSDMEKQSAVVATGTVTGAICVFALLFIITWRLKKARVSSGNDRV